MASCPFGSFSYILPQILVARKSALTTQLRICFNASSTAYAGRDQSLLSLNDLLLQDPKLQSDLTVILTKFRLNKVGLIADIEMMFRMVEVNPEDRKYLHIFSRKEPSIDLSEYELNVLPFGLRSSPYLAQRVIQELINCDGHLYPKAAEALRNALYVDDFVNACGSIEEARQIKEDLSSLLGRGGFTLRKWATSHPKILENTSFENKERILFDDENQTVKVLGLQWDPQRDSFTYKFTKFDAAWTKRNCLSYIARTFDCLGFVAPVIFWMKRFLQQLWIIKLNWDDPLPSHLSQLWTEFTNDIEKLIDIKIPRPVFYPGVVETRLACFSQSGYATCVYLVVKSMLGEVSSYLLTAKSKLAPLRTISIPRLVLCGALLMTRLCRHTLESLQNLHIHSVHLFTDSEIVLAWIKTPPHRLNTFVANRITNIQEQTKNMKWSHVSTIENPSDLATRGIQTSRLVNNSLWWAGPDFLKNELKKWSEESEYTLDEIPELKSNLNLLVIEKPKEAQYLYETCICKYSSLMKLQRIFAYILRFIHNVRKPERRSGALSAVELHEALLACIQISQQHDFADDVVALQQNNASAKKLST